MQIDNFFKWKAIRDAKTKQAYAIGLSEPFELAAMWRTVESYKATCLDAGYELCSPEHARALGVLAASCLDLLGVGAGATEALTHDARAPGVTTSEYIRRLRGIARKIADI